MVKGLKRSTIGFTLAAVASAALVVPAFAQDDVEPATAKMSYEQPTSGGQWFPEQGVLGPFSATVGVDVVTSYWFRGYEQEDSGGIFQPYTEVGLMIYENEDSWLNSIDAYVGWWNSVQTEETGGDSAWYETDIYAGFNVGFLEYFSFGFMFIDYEYPGDAADAIREVDMSLAMDDSPFWAGMLPEDLGFGIYPYFLYAQEVENQNAQNFLGAYAEFGIEPGLTVPISDNFGIDISMPMYAGTSINEYYFDAEGDETFFGYFAIGLNVGVPLTFIPEDFGSWEVHAGVTGLFLNGQGTEDSGDDKGVYGTLGMSVTF